MSNAVRQLQHLVLDEACVDCYDLYQSEKKNNGTGGYCGTAIERQLAELVYQKRSEKLLADENCFKIFIVSFPILNIPALFELCLLFESTADSADPHALFSDGLHFIF